MRGLHEKYEIREVYIEKEMLRINEILQLKFDVMKPLMTQIDGHRNRLHAIQSKVLSWRGGLDGGVYIAFH